AGGQAAGGTSAAHPAGGGEGEKPPLLPRTGRVRAAATRPPAVPDRRRQPAGLGLAVAAVIDREGGVADPRELLRVRKPLAHVSTALMDEHDRPLPGPEQVTHEMRAVGRAEADVPGLRGAAVERVAHTRPDERTDERQQDDGGELQTPSAASGAPRVFAASSAQAIAASARAIP